MKSRTVASILRHVATKLPSLSDDAAAASAAAEPAPPADAPPPTDAAAPAEAPTPVVPAPALTLGAIGEPEPELDTKEGRRAARKRERAAAAVSQGGAGTEEAAGGGPPGEDASEEERLETLYDLIGWPLHKTYGHTYEAFKLALTCVPSSSSTQRNADQSRWPPQRARHRLGLAPRPAACRGALPAPGDDRAPAHAAADKAARRRRAHVLHARGDRRDPARAARGRARGLGGGADQGEARRAAAVRAQHERDGQGAP
jgi:hypothetical protein